MSSEGGTSDAHLRRQIRRVNMVLLLVLLALVVGPMFVTWWVAREYPSINTVQIRDMALVNGSELCPEEPLIVRYTLHAAGSGVLVRDATVWSMDPPRTVIYSQSRRFILEGPLDEARVETWHMPTMHVNPETDRLEPLPPGAYRRLLAISSPANRQIIAISGVDFTIREDCDEA